MDRLLPEKLQTVRLLLRRSITEDAPALYRMSVDPQVARYLDYSTDLDEGVFARELEASASGNRKTVYSICGKADSAHADTVLGMARVRARDGIADIGFLIAADYWQQGYATEAVTVLVQALLQLSFVKRVVAVCDVENEVSARVLERCSLSLVGTSERLIACPNITGRTRRDALMYATVQK